MVELGYEFAYRILDAQYFGLAQRRKRVFVVGYLGDWRCAAAVLFERESLSGHPAPGSNERQSVAGTLGSRASAGGGLGTDFDLAGGLQVAKTVLRGGHSNNPLDENLVAIPILEAGARTGKSTDDPRAGIGIGQDGDPMFTLQSGKQHAVAFRTTGNDGCYETGDRIGALNTASDPNQDVVAISLRGREGGATAELSGDVMPALRTGGGGGDKPHALGSFGVRRLTPRECERLQGFPDDYTKIEWRGRPAEQCPDGPRYRALGNSMAVPVMAWIGRGISAVEARP
jgi:DNA (cytosine-5)-methyltransferase 1